MTAPSAGISENGSRKGLSSRNSRVPSGLNGYRLSDCFRVADAVRHHHRVVPGVLGRPGQGRVERGVGHRLGIGETHGTSGRAAPRARGTKK